MLSVELDLHKGYSQVEALDESGERRLAAPLVNEFEEIEDFFRFLGKNGWRGCYGLRRKGPSITSLLGAVGASRRKGAEGSRVL